MPPPNLPTGLVPDIHLQGGLLTPAIRRDLADLNRQFLELGLAPELASDPRFGWCESVRLGLLQTERSIRDRMAACPFGLFEVQLPAIVATPGSTHSRVEDGAIVPALGEPWNARCMAFVQFAFFVAWRMADSVPLATRLALGLSPAAEHRLNEMCPSELAQLAASPAAVRPRWPAHDRFWRLLISAAAGHSASSLQQAHCFGMCLLLSDLNEAGGAGRASPPRRRPPG
jgi:hypothetical protein